MDKIAFYKGYTEGMEKVGKLNDKQKDRLIGATLVGGGAAAVKSGSPLLRGKQVWYHGTSAKAAPSILQEGIKTMGEMGGKGGSVTGGILSSIDSDVGRKVKGLSDQMAFVGKRGQAYMYAAQAQLFDKLVTKHGPETASRLFTKYMTDGSLPIKMLEEGVFPGLAGKVLKVEVPVHEIHRLKKNPELMNVEYFKKHPPLMDLFGNHERQMKAMEKALINSRGIEGGVSPDMLAGGKGWKSFNLKGMKAKPLRTLGGASLVAGGLAAAGYGGYRLASPLIKKIKERRENA
jgi:hypothetical protein